MVSHLSPITALCAPAPIRHHKHGRPPFQRHLLVSSLALALSAPALAANYNVAVGSDDGTGSTPNTLSWAILQANTGGPHTITLGTDVTMTGVMKRLINSNVTIQSDATPRTVACGDNPYRPFFVKSGTVTLSNLTVSHWKAAGGDISYGGGGAGSLEVKRQGSRQSIAQGVLIHRCNA